MNKFLFGVSILMFFLEWKLKSLMNRIDSGERKLNEGENLMPQGSFVLMGLLSLMVIAFRMLERVYSK